MRVLVTGGSKRVGRIVCEALATAGADIVVHYKQSHKEAEELAQHVRDLGRNAVALSCNLEDLEHLPALVKESAQALGGPLTGLVNNASVFDYDNATGIKLSVFDQAMKVNLAAPLVLSEAFYHQAEPGVNNTVVDFLDQKLWNLNPDFYSYTLSKAALQASIEMRAVAFSPRVRVCGIAPGLLLPSFDQTDSEFRAVASRNLNRAPIDPAEIGHAALFLLQNRSMNGQVLHVDNGQRFTKMDRDVMFENREQKQ
jgi:NAD(P)-dependent dehydrogenase (short-subunit alcohol dehydrogenase family)